MRRAVAVGVVTVTVAGAVLTSLDATGHTIAVQSRLVVGPVVRLTAGSPFPRPCSPTAVPGYEVEPTATFSSVAHRLVAAWQADRASQGADGIVAATSDDGGSTWTSRAVPGISLCSGGSSRAVSDPWLTSGPEGTVYLSALEVRKPHRNGALGSSVVVVRSLDGGLSWQPSVIVAPDVGKSADKPTATADPLRPGVAYVTWGVTDGTRSDVLLSRTLNAGASWSAPAVVSRAGRDQHDLFPEVEVMPGGTVVDVYTHVGAREVLGFSHQARVSTDAGATWSTPERIDQQSSFPMPISLSPPAYVRSDPHVFALVGGAGGAYLVSAIITQRGARGASTLTSRILVSRQLSDGTWTAPATVARVSGSAFLPTVATSGARRVAVTWYQMPLGRRSRHSVRLIPGTIETAISVDQGRAWQQRPLGARFNLENVDRHGEIFVGDYQALTATPGGFEAIDVRTPTRSGADGSDVFAQAIAERP